MDSIECGQEHTAFWYLLLCCRCRYFAAVVWNLSQNIKFRPHNVFYAMPVKLLISCPRVLLNCMTCPRYTFSGTWSRVYGNVLREHNANDLIKGLSTQNWIHSSNPFYGMGIHRCFSYHLVCVEALQWTDLERKKLDRMLEGSIVYNSNSEEGYIVCSLNNMENSLFL